MHRSLAYYRQRLHVPCDDCGGVILIFGGLREVRVQLWLAGWSWEPQVSSEHKVLRGAARLGSLEYIETRCVLCRLKRWWRRQRW